MMRSDTKKTSDSMMKHPWMWLVLGLPATVVAAGFATLWIAASDPQAIVVEPHRKSGFTVEQAVPTVSSQHLHEKAE
ncbi:MAG: FixH family protein [Limnobacter sp.]|uniref:FixH family protein n=1 Tax=Limnobacter sp. TaxID=2003368 RepID=UPI0022BC806D|nr:FixH family protein [Limnobacter sp.]MCZ8016057.1 FixH family protein [Limnobacter sp.]